MISHTDRNIKKVLKRAHKADKQEVALFKCRLATTRRKRMRDKGLNRERGNVRTEMEREAVRRE